MDGAVPVICSVEVGIHARRGEQSTCHGKQKKHAQNRPQTAANTHWCLTAGHTAIRCGTHSLGKKYRRAKGSCREPPRHDPERLRRLGTLSRIRTAGSSNKSTGPTPPKNRCGRDESLLVRSFKVHQRAPAFGGAVREICYFRVFIGPTACRTQCDECEKYW